MHVIIPALNEEEALPGVLAALPTRIADAAVRVLVVDNGSTDRTAASALASGARVVREGRRGYGSACLAGIAALSAHPEDDVVVFLDADGSDDPRALGTIVAPVLDGEAELVLGSRTIGDREAGALPAHARAGNALAVALIRMLTGARYTDLGPFRAIRAGALRGLGMSDPDFGWTVEMQMRASRAGLVTREVAVAYRRRRGGRSKVSGSAWGSVRAGYKILRTIARHA